MKSSVWAFYLFLNRQAELPQQELDVRENAGHHLFQTFSSFSHC